VSRQLCTHEGCRRRPAPHAQMCGFHQLRHDRGLPMDLPTPELRSLKAAERVCAVDGCARLRKLAGSKLCDAHKRRIDRGWPLDLPIRGEPRTCTHPGCHRPYSVNGLCNAHALRKQRGRDMDSLIRESVRPEDRPETCGWRDCSSPYYARGYCQLHYNRKCKGVSMDARVRRAPVPGVSTRTTRFGYVHVYLPDHPHARGDGWVNQHRHVMEQQLGRLLHKHENVHHKNGDRADNRPENLELWITAQPSGQRVKDLLAHARWILSLYGSPTERHKYGRDREDVESVVEHPSGRSCG
jgi:hypothetical protein